MYTGQCIYRVYLYAGEQMCCEQEACYVAVFDHTEAVCFLKGPGAVHTYDYVKKDGFTSFEMLFREGRPVELYSLSSSTPSPLSM